MKLAADNMLTKLARWIRLGGISIEDVPYESDDEIINFVKKRKELLLTSDKQLANRSRKRKFSVLLIREQSIEKQLAYVIKELKLKPKVPGNICTLCNGKLEKISKRDVKEIIPKAVYEKHRIFYKCSKCGKIYWRGTHLERIKKVYKKAIELSKEID